MDFSQYIRPELLILIPVINVIGAAIKRSAVVKDNYIPFILGIAGAILGTAYTMLFSKEGCSMWQNALMGMLQGILCAGMAVYGHQMKKQMKKGDAAPLKGKDKPQEEENTSNVNREA